MARALVAHTASFPRRLTDAFSSHFHYSPTLTTMAPKYERLPTEPDSSPPSRSLSLSPLPPYEPPLTDDVEHDAPRRPSRSNTRHQNRELLLSLEADPRFNPPTPSPWARAGIILFMFLMFYLSYLARRAVWVDTGMGMGKPPKPVDPSY